MAAKRTTTPTSVILTLDQKAFIKRVAEKEGRSYSSMVRFIILQWIDGHSKREKRNGKESEKGQEVGQKGQEVGA
jgi:hypothetical protein